MTQDSEESVTDGIGKQPNDCPHNTEAWCDYPFCDCQP